MASPFGERVRTAVVEDTHLAYREQGDGDPVIFVHGAVSDLRTWSAQVDAIGEHHRAIAYSCRYARPNDDVPDGADNQVGTHVGDLVALLHALDAAPAHLVGHSSGAFACLLTAIRHPEVVRTLVLEEPPVMTLFVSAQPRPGELVRLLASRPRTAAAIIRMGATSLGPAEKAFRRGDDERALRAFMRGILGRAHFRRLSAARRRQTLDNMRGLRAILLGDGLPDIHDEEIRQVTAPTLLISGADSPPFGRRLTDRLHELLPQSTRIRVAGASHFAHEDNARAVNDAILRFLAEDHASASPLAHSVRMRQQAG